MSLMTGATRLRLESSTSTRDTFITQVEVVESGTGAVWRDATPDDVDAQGNLRADRLVRTQNKSKKKR